MKKVLVAAILGLAATASVMAQGRIQLNSYSGSYPTVTYGPNSGGSGIVLGGQGFTVGLYYQNTAGATFVDASGFGVPDGSWELAAGTGATALFVGGGYFSTPNDFSIAAYVDTSPNPNTLNVSLVVVAYNGADYASSTIRGHSAAFNLLPAVGAGVAPGVGVGMGSFQVIGVPEPSTFALAGLGLASLLIFRRRK